MVPCHFVIFFHKNLSKIKTSKGHLRDAQEEIPVPYRGFSFSIYNHTKKPISPDKKKRRIQTMYHGFPRCSPEVLPQIGHFEVFFLEYNVPQSPHTNTATNGTAIYLVRTQFHI